MRSVAVRDLSVYESVQPGFCRAKGIDATTGRPKSTRWTMRHYVPLCVVMCRGEKSPMRFSRPLPSTTRPPRPKTKKSHHASLYTTAGQVTSGSRRRRTVPRCSRTARIAAPGCFRMSKERAAVFSPGSRWSRAPRSYYTCSKDSGSCSGARPGCPGSKRPGLVSGCGDSRTHATDYKPAPSLSSSDTRPATESARAAIALSPASAKARAAPL